MFEKPVTIYLAGAIRDEHIAEDSTWRALIIRSLRGLPVRILNPLAAKTFNKTTRDWKLINKAPTASVIVPHDYYCVKESDICVFNFNALSQGYPNIGTLCEFGAASVLNKLIYTVIDPNYTGHSNTKLFKLHPFIEFASSLIFDSTNECIVFLRGYIPVLSGLDPHFGGVK